MPSLLLGASRWQPTSGLESWREVTADRTEGELGTTV